MKLYCDLCGKEFEVDCDQEDLKDGYFCICDRCDNDREDKMTNCKHGNGPDCQYERDAGRVKGTGHDRKVETTESVLLNLVNAHIFRVNQLAEQADDVASCIPDWIDKLTKSLRSEFVNKGANSCRLCVKYRPAKCVGCPIFEDIENPTCIDAPEEKKGLISAYSAIEMIEYLIRLERKLRTHPLLKPDKCATCRHSYEKKEG